MYYELVFDISSVSFDGDRHRGGAESVTTAGAPQCGFSA
jgi:hypothetical protein